MKKLMLVVLLSSCLVTMFTGCEGGDPSNGEDVTADTSVDDPDVVNDDGGWVEDEDSPDPDGEDPPDEVTLENCGNMVCNQSHGENCNTCPDDCGCAFDESCKPDEADDIDGCVYVLAPYEFIVENSWTCTEGWELVEGTKIEPELYGALDEGAWIWGFSPCKDGTFIQLSENEFSFTGTDQSGYSCEGTLDTLSFELIFSSSDDEGNTYDWKYVQNQSEDL